MQPDNNEQPQVPGPSEPQQPVVSNDPTSTSADLSSGVTTPAESTPTAPQVIQPELPTETNTDFPAQGIYNPQPSAPEATTQAQPDVGGAFAAAPVAVASKPSFFSRFKSKKLLILVALLPVLFIGGGAAAYYGVVVPNKPENTLLIAIGNTLQEKQVNYEGTLEMSAADPKKDNAMTATNIAFKGQTDTEAQTSALTADVTVYGVKVQGELRYVGGSAFVKLGDLSTVKGLVNAYAPGAGPAIDKLQNQWIEIDSTLLKQADADCALNTKIAFTEDELKFLANAAKENGFATIKSKTSDQVNGKNATKFELSLDDNKMAEYVKNFDQISFVKKLKECNKEFNTDDTKDLADGDATPLTVWVDKSSKRIVKLASETTEQDANKDNIKGTFSVVLSYGGVKIEKPSGAKPVMSILSELQSLTGGSLGGGDSSSLLLNNSLNLLQ